LVGGALHQEEFQQKYLPVAQLQDSRSAAVQPVHSRLCCPSGDCPPGEDKEQEVF